MNWELIRRGVLAYTILGAGVVAAPAILLLGGARAAIGLVAAGLLLVLYLLSGSAAVSAGAVMANAEAGGLRSGVVDVGNGGRGPRWNAVTALFLAVGFLGWGLLAALSYVLR